MSWIPAIGVLAITAPAIALLRPQAPRISLALVAACVLLATAQGVIAPIGLLWLALLFGSAAWIGSKRTQGGVVAWIVFVPLALILGAGLAPGFEPWVITEPTVLKDGSAPFSLRLRLEKALVATALLLWVVPRAMNGREWRMLLMKTLPVALLTMAVVYALALVFGYVRFTPGLPHAEIVLPWLAINLFMVCTTEEGFFRGVVQHRLAQRMPVAAAIGIGAVLFGLVHVGGGLMYVLLATLAGAGYGIAFHRTGGRVEAAIAAHFALNLGHLAVFSYPYAV